MSRSAGEGPAGPLSQLTTTQAPLSRPAKAKAKLKKAVAESWEDESVSSSEPDESEPSSPCTATTDKVETKGRGSATTGTASGVAAPPPTPISPTTAVSAAPWLVSQASESSSSMARRPEKTDAVARRLIAGALGVKAPRLTEEQKAYDRALREKERRKREEEKAAAGKRQEEAKRAKAAIWED